MSFIFSGIDHVQLAAPRGSEAQARTFYGELLGWEEIPKPEELRKRGGVWFQCGHHQVHIGVEDDFRPAKKAHPAIHVENLVEFREYLITRGIPVKDDDALEGAVRFYLEDPFGNRLEFLEWIE